MMGSPILETPRQGRISLLAFLAMLVVVGLTIPARLPLSTTDSDQPLTLALLMVTAGLIGYVLARSGIGIVRSHIIGAATGAGLLLLVVGAAVQGGEGRPLLTWLFELDLLEARMAALWTSIRSEGDPTRAAGLLILGAICWTTGQFGASSIFRFDRGMPAVTAAGVPLLAVIAVPARSGVPIDAIDVVVTLAAFTFAAMVLLVRMQLNQQRNGWARRHIADAGDVSRLFLRTGVFFVAFTVIGASTLTAASQNASFDDVFDGFDVELPQIEGLEWLTDIFAPDDGEGPALPSLGGPAPKSQDWEEVKGWAFTVLDGNPNRNYWWLTAWDRWDGETFQRSERTRTEVPPDGRLVPLPDYDTRGRGQDIQTAVVIGDTGYAQTTVVAPSEATDLNGLGATVHSIGPNGSRAFVEHDEPLEAGQRIVIDSSSLDYDPSTTEVTEEALRNAPRRYPDDIVDRYTGLKNAPLGPRTSAFIEEIVLWADSTGNNNPYDISREIETRFTRDFGYTTEMTVLCDGLTQPECVLQHEQGFCTFFAQTMTIALQDMGIPSRYVWGYLPGDPADVDLDGQHEIDNSWLHAWTEVYFHEFGWVRFDPTPGGRFGQTPFDPPDEEPPEATPGPEFPPEPGPDPDETDEPEVAPTPSPEPTEPPTGFVAAIIAFFGGDGGSGGGLWLLLAGAVLFVLLSALAAVRLLRLPGRDPGLAYRGIVALATRFGHGPHPAQTELEYAATLAERIPTVNDDLHLVVATQVSNVYAEMPADAAARKPLGRAYARIRTALLRMRLRRGR